MVVETEDNGDTSRADSLSSGLATSGNISGRSDVDFYTIYAADAGTISINFDSPLREEGLDAFTITVSDSSKNILASNVTRLDTSFSTGLSNAGNYYISVTDEYAHDDGQYRLMVTVPEGPSESEDNGSRSTADVVTSGSAIKGQVASQSDLDYYKIEASSAGIINVVFDAPTNSSSNDYFKVAVVDGAGNVLSTSSLTLRV